ncbi:MAG: hypothetical protein IJR42_01355 [Paludibacteraceae bacterium]|nr:hypothetical protein [Paludibacteraceae bacterium]
MATYIFDKPFLDKAIAGVRALKLAELKARKEISWWLDSRHKSAVVAEYRQLGGRGAGIAIDLDVMTEDGYSDKKNIGLSTSGTGQSTANSEERAFDSVKQSALRRLEVLKSRGII